MFTFFDGSFGYQFFFPVVPADLFSRNPMAIVNLQMKVDVILLVSFDGVDVNY
ncbi:hypothetical protein FM038_25345 [Shewanella eurypsychrophilus]|uniref:Transposase n=1 Tax=Shewanella eurypsychrophilus TaxID=2593656 RepID=A0ABX8S387_9GAMM|nr:MULTISPECIES: hypothetical protein [Shewanella]QXP44983.1 hypothetical protein FM038_25345 [Shewanella eurypsychrophilus]